MWNTALMLFWIWQCVVCAASMRGACVFFAFAGWDETFGNFENQNNAGSLLLLEEGVKNGWWIKWLLIDMTCKKFGESAQLLPPSTPGVSALFSLTWQFQCSSILGSKSHKSCLSASISAVQDRGPCYVFGAAALLDHCLRLRVAVWLNCHLHLMLALHFQVTSIPDKILKVRIKSFAFWVVTTPVILGAWCIVVINLDPNCCHYDQIKHINSVTSL